MITSCYLLFLSSVCVVIKLRQPLAQLGEAHVGVVLEVVILQGLELPVDAAMPGCRVQHLPLTRVLGANRSFFLHHFHNIALYMCKFIYKRLEVNMPKISKVVPC